MKKTEILVRIYEVAMQNARHMEAQRSTVTNFIMAVTVALLILFSQTSNIAIQIVISTALLVLGLYGALTVYKLYERFRYHICQAQEFLCHIDSLEHEIEIMKIIEISEQHHSERFSPKYLLYFRMHVTWIIMNTIIAFLGIILLLVSFLKLI